MTRRHVYSLLITSWLMLLSSLAQAALPASVEGQPMPTLAPMLKRTSPAVANIATLGYTEIHQNPLFQDPFFRRFFDLPEGSQRRQTQSLGSGVIVDAEHGYILTNNHVIEHAEKIRVTLHDGRSFDAKLIGTDPDSDVAVIHIDADKLTAVPLGDSDALEVGDFAVAIGNPFGLGQTVTSGIVSALGRSDLGIEGYEDFIQTDASINPGNSGGALVNLRGELIGINTAILAPSGGNVGIGFAIPVNMAREIMQQLIEHGSVRRGQLGVTAQDLTPELASAFGLQGNQGTVVAHIAKGSAAEKAGLQVGDIILKIDGRPVENSGDVRNRVGLLRVGSSVDMQVLRNGEEKTITAKLEAPRLENQAGAELNPLLTGATFSTLSNAPGVVIGAVEPGSAAWDAGLRKGDIVLSANRTEVSNVAEFAEQVKDRRQLLLNVQRGDTALFILIG